MPPKSHPLAILAFTLIPFADTAVADLVAHYAMDETSGAVVADSIGANDGALIGSGAAAHGIGSPNPALGTAIDFDLRAGVDLGTAAEVRPVDQWTMTWWMRPDTLNDFDRIYESLAGTGNNGNGIRIDLGSSPGNRLRVLLRDGNGTSNTTVTHSQVLASGSWYFVAVRYDTSVETEEALKLTVIPSPANLTAAQVTSATEHPATLGTGPINVHAAGAYLAADDGGAATSNDFGGALDDFAVFQDGSESGVLTDAQVAQVANIGALAFDPPAPLPTIQSFTATPSGIAGGGAANLSWQVTDADTLGIDEGIGNVDALTNNGSGSLAVSPAVTTVYALSATNAEGTVEAMVQVTVDGEALPPVISEFLASNSSFEDGDGNTPDWIELRNRNTSALDVSGFFLTDDAAELNKWPLPAGTSISGDGYLVVFASGQSVLDYVDAGGHPHANFSLDADGDYLALVAPDGTTIVQEFAPTYPPQFEDVSHDGNGYLTVPTPGMENDSNSVQGIVADTTFSADRGFYDAPISVEITSATPEAEIYYTTDGTAPSPVNGTLCTAPVAISETTVLRAVAFKSGFEPTNIDTQTYIFTADVIQQSNSPPGYPSIWAGRTADYEMDPEVVNDPAYEGQFDAALKALPTVSVVMDPDDMFGAQGIYENPQSQGRAWERPASAEFIVADGSEPGFHLNCGIRVQGGSSRNPDTPKHSLSLRFRKEYGAGKLRYPLYENEVGGASAVDEFDLLQLRPEYNHGWMHRHYYQAREAQYNRDQWASDLYILMGNPGTHGRWTHLYINGIYWGVYDLQERPDADFMASYFGGTDDDYDTLNSGNVNSGDRNAYNTMIGIANGNIADNAVYASIAEYLDIDAFIDYMMMNFYVGNRDWDGHNWRAGRKREAGAPYYFFPWDTEFAISPNNAGGNQNPAPLSAALNTDVTNRNGANRPTGLHRRLALNAEYRLRFADRMHRHMFNGGVLAPESVAATWRRRSDLMDLAIVAESARWGDFRRDVDAAGWTSADFDLFTKDDHYLPDQAWIFSTFFPQRTAIAFDQMQSRQLYPATAAPEFNQHGGAVPVGFQLTMTAPNVVFYTTDGSDPREVGGAVGATASAYQPGVPTMTPVEFVGENPVAAFALRVHVPSDGTLGTTWTAHDFGDATWTATAAGSLGVGYEVAPDGDYLPAIDHGLRAEMHNINATVYLRYVFDVTDAASFTELQLGALYDDGFVAYLNGQEIGAENRPVSPAWDARSAAGHEAADLDNYDAIATVDLTASPGLLREGTNVLAVHALNLSSSSSDFLFVPELVGIQSENNQQDVIALEGSVHMKARTLNNGEWSALAEAFFNAGDLRITEIMYRPSANRSAEFLELSNTGTSAISLEGMRFVSGIEFGFSGSAVTALGPGERLLVVRDLGAFQSVHGNAHDGIIAGVFENGTALSNDGETLTLVDANDQIVTTLTYNDQAPWPESADGDGYSLVFVDGDPAESGNWRHSASVGGNPGGTDSVPFEGEPLADGNGNGVEDLADYYLASEGIGVHPVVVPALSSEGMPTLAFEKRAASDDAFHVVEQSSAGDAWTDGSADWRLDSRTAVGEARERLVYVFDSGGGLPDRLLVRLRISTVP